MWKQQKTEKHHKKVSATINRCDHLIQVSFTVRKWMLNRGWPLNTALSVVFLDHTSPI